MERPLSSTSQMRNHLAAQQCGRLKCLFAEYKGQWGSKLLKGEDNTFHARRTKPGKIRVRRVSIIPAKGKYIYSYDLGTYWHAKATAALWPATGSPAGMKTLWDRELCLFFCTLP